MSDIYGTGAQGQPAPQDQIFLPIETISQRVIEAEKQKDAVERKNEDLQKENTQIRRQRSRAVIGVIMFAVAFLTALLFGFLAYLWAQDQVARATADAKAVVEDARAGEDRALTELNEAEEDASSLRKQLVELAKFQEVSNLEISIANRREKMENHRRFYAGETEGDLPEGVFEVDLPDWNFSNDVDASNWQTKVAAGLAADREAFDAAIKRVEDWRVQRGKARKPPSACTRSNPWAPETTC